MSQGEEKGMEFDEEAFNDEYYEQRDSEDRERVVATTREIAYYMARWQHSQMLPIIQAKDAEIERLKDELNRIKHDNRVSFLQLGKTLSDRERLIEKLREQLEAKSQRIQELEGALGRMDCEYRYVNPNAYHCHEKEHDPECEKCKALNPKESES